MGAITNSSESTSRPYIKIVTRNTSISEGHRRADCPFLKIDEKDGTVHRDYNGHYRRRDRSRKNHDSSPERRSHDDDRDGDDRDTVMDMDLTIALVTETDIREVETTRTRIIVIMRPIIGMTTTNQGAGVATGTILLSRRPSIMWSRSESRYRCILISQATSLCPDG
eukprot:TRINITY_DN17736_c0_g1_i1.p1 TRINITY_DN17736_c0_g1~~TRINITY_DN17736_c0_g1_i1.p1  ORF type:complete len:167 (-),score=8.78 TRINITY_DN17736_c0_g1_i1:533-1033(-)